MAKQALCKLRL